MNVIPLLTTATMFLLFGVAATVVGVIEWRESELEREVACGALVIGALTLIIGSGMALDGILRLTGVG